MTADALTGLRRVQDALAEQRVEVEMLRRQTAQLKEETEALRANLLRYAGAWTPVRRGLTRIGETCRDTERRMDAFLTSERVKA
ncbi:MAG: hypothetical protein RIB45_16055 [Marivibrio sp.]|uniref:hypothetical protein n=1 Tax=Marivibrio sp. TaxID=2039719 RepID=UPI0032F00109